MARYIDSYERLRGAVVHAQGRRPEGLAALAYHGMFGGLKVICAEAATAPTALLPVPAAADPAPSPSPIDPALVRLLTNMVLIHHQELSHVI